MFNFRFSLIENVSLLSLRLARTRTTSKQLPGVVSRWLHAWDAHGIERHQIPSILRSWTGRRSALVDPVGSRLIDFLPDEVLDETCGLLNIRRAWLDHDDQEMPFDPLVLGERHVDGLIRELVRLKGLDSYPELIAFRSGHQEIGEESEQSGGCFCGRRSPHSAAASATFTSTSPFTVCGTGPVRSSASLQCERCGSPAGWVSTCWGIR